MKDLYGRIQENIALFGQHVMGVVATDGPSFFYTIGNHGRGLPELIVFGASTDFARLLNLLGQLQSERGKAFLHGELVSIGGKHPVKVLEAGVRAKEEFTIQAGQYYGTEAYRVLQVLVCDPAGRFPGDPLCDPAYAGQPILHEPVMPTVHGRDDPSLKEWQDWLPAGRG